jgi:hypothetical protein
MPHVLVFTYSFEGPLKLVELHPNPNSHVGHGKTSQRGLDLPPDLLS